MLTLANAIHARGGHSDLVEALMQEALTVALRGATPTVVAPPSGPPMLAELSIAEGFPNEEANGSYTHLLANAKRTDQLVLALENEWCSAYALDATLCNTIRLGNTTCQHDLNRTCLSASRPERRAHMRPQKAPASQATGDEDHLGACRRMQTAYSIVLLSSWGTTPPQEQIRWKRAPRARLRSLPRSPVAFSRLSSPELPRSTSHFGTLSPAGLKCDKILRRRSRGRKKSAGSG